MDQYYQTIKDFPVISSDEEKILVRKMIKGNLSAREKLIVSNRRLVIDISRKYWGDLEDFIQEGYIGLIKAIDNFNPKYKCKISTYASRRIKRRITNYIDNNRASGLDNDYRHFRASVFEVIENYIKSEGKNPSFNHIYHILKNKYKNLNEEDIRKILNHNKIISFYKDDLDLSDYFEDKSVDFREPIMKKDFLERIDFHFQKSGISGIGYSIMKQHHIENKTFREIAENIGLNHTKIRNIYHYNLAIFREYFFRNNLISKLF